MLGMRRDGLMTLFFRLILIQHVLRPATCGVICITMSKETLDTMAFNDLYYEYHVLPSITHTIINEHAQNISYMRIVCSSRPPTSSPATRPLRSRPPYYDLAIRTQHYYFLFLTHTQQAFSFTIFPIITENTR
jgi:hypothetical protein